MASQLEALQLSQSSTGTGNRRGQPTAQPKGPAAMLHRKPHESMTSLPPTSNTEKPSTAASDTLNQVPMQTPQQTGVTPGEEIVLQLRDTFSAERPDNR